MRALYTALLYLLAPFLLIVFALRRGWRGRLGERLGLGARIDGGVDLWLHAASVGEVQAARPLVEAWLPRRRVLVTTFTPAGARHARALFGTRVVHRLLPLDLPDAVARFLARAQPRRAVIVETELWPNLIHALAARGLPPALVNARISERSFRRYARVPSLVRSCLQRCALIAAQSPADAGRLNTLGAPPERLHVTGNLKFELLPPPEQVSAGRALRTAAGPGRPVWIAASTHQGEEGYALEAHRAVLREFPEALLVLVPRHPQRFDAVQRLLARSGLSWARRGAGTATATVVLGDTMGELFLYYAAADVAFVGGSLVPVGGHNLLEPAALGLPVLSGAHLANFAQARELLIAAGGLEIVSADGLGEAVRALLRDPARRQRQGDAARAAVAAHRGALQRTLDLLALPPTA